MPSPGSFQTPADHPGPTSSDEEQDNLDDDWGDWVEDGATPTSTLVYPPILTPSVQAALEHDLRVHGFCFQSLVKRLELDTLSRIKMINWIRAGPSNSRTKEELQSIKGDEDWLVETSDQWLIPRLPGDGMLQFDFDDEEVDGTGTSRPLKNAHSETSPSQQLVDLNQRLLTAQEELAALRAIVNRTMDVAIDLKPNNLESVQRSSKILSSMDDDTHYFSSYAHYSIHASMIQDQVRTNSYQTFITSNPQIFKDKRVMDIGCGTGILSFFAAQAGAKKVYAIDASQIATNAAQHMRINQVSDKVDVINKKVEDLDLEVDLQGEKVDVIISEWMGYACLYEAFLPSVLYARDRFMKPPLEGGLMAPSQCSILMAGWGDEAWWKNEVTWWDENPYGFKMGSTMPKRQFTEGLVTSVSDKDLLTGSTVLRDVHTSTMPSQSTQCIPFVDDFVLKPCETMTDSKMLHGFVVWFDTFFTVDGRAIDGDALEKTLSWKKVSSEVAFSTSPRSTDTHWHQTVLVVQEPFLVTNSTILTGTFNCSINPDNSRELVICLTWKVNPDPNQSSVSEYTQMWII